MTDSDSDESPPRPPRGKAPALSKPFSLDSIREIEASLGNVSRAADYPMARGQASPERSARANTITGGRAPAIPRVVEPEQGPRPRPRPRPRATTSPPTGPSPFAPSSYSSSRPPNRPQFLEVPRRHQAPHQAQPRYRPFPPQQAPGPSQPQLQPPAPFRPPPRPSPNQPATTAAIRGPPEAARPPPPPQARPAAAVTPGPSRSPGYGVGDPTIPNNPYGYLPAPPLRHNWNTPNRGAAQGARNPRGWTTGRSGRPLGPPLASRPRPPAAMTWFNQGPERSASHTIQEETEKAMSGLALGPGPRDGREDRSTFVRTNTGPSQGSLSGSDAGAYADAQNQQRSNTPYTPDLSNPSTTSTPRTGTLDTPMSASALPVWGEEYQYFSPEEAAVVLQSNRPTTIYINRSSENPAIPPGPMPMPVKEEDEESEDDFS